jgi:nucleoside 2-deoxyribosyltransferase
MKIYVAGKWSHKDFITEQMKLLQEMGYQITHNWTKNESITRSPEELSKFAELDVNGVLHADVVLVYMTDKDYPYRGTFTEIGVALGSNKQILIVCPDKDSYCRTNCFFYHPHIKHFDTVGMEMGYLNTLINKKKSE